ncbi:MAG: photosynthetic reaction center cytochrome c subunit [Alphaproteobacteria bacterium]|nr:photosynthetic reaction center cytochrome c subunit [Alphaproteobacteria bacterium]
MARASIPKTSKFVHSANPLGRLGDSQKRIAGTCHQGVSKPLYGQEYLLKDFPERGGKTAP